MCKHPSRNHHTPVGHFASARAVRCCLLFVCASILFLLVRLYHRHLRAFFLLRTLSTLSDPFVAPTWSHQSFLCHYLQAAQFLAQAVTMPPKRADPGKLFLLLLFSHYFPLAIANHNLLKALLMLAALLDVFRLVVSKTSSETSRPLMVSPSDPHHLVLTTPTLRPQDLQRPRRFLVAMHTKAEPSPT